jgi:hypothetical protein
MLGNGIYVSTSIRVPDGVQWAAPCKAECHLIDKESTDESVSLLATYLARTYSFDKDFPIQIMKKLVLLIMTLDKHEFIVVTCSS